MINDLAEGAWAPPSFSNHIMHKAQKTQCARTVAADSLAGPDGCSVQGQDSLRCRFMRKARAMLPKVTRKAGRDHQYKEAGRMRRASTVPIKARRATR